MAATVKDFWRIVGECQLFAPDECRQLQTAYERRSDQSENGSASSAAQWLISSGMLTKYQAQSMLSGRGGPLVVGDYRITDRIVDGRLAGLLRVVHAKSGKPALLYPLPGTLSGDPKKLGQVKKQAAAAASLKSPHIAQVLGWTEADGKHFVVVEPLDGQPIPHNLQKPIAPEKACRIAYDLAAGLDALHRKGVAHGAVAPWNAWIDKSGKAKLLHFPIARKSPNAKPGEEQSAAEMSVQFQAPESAASKPTPTADVYSLGCAFYQLLTGQVIPSKRDQLATALAALKPDVVPVLVRMLAQAPGERPADGGVLLDVLGPLVGRPSQDDHSASKRSASTSPETAVPNQRSSASSPAPRASSAVPVAAVVSSPFSVPAGLPIGIPVGKPVLPSASEGADLLPPNGIPPTSAILPTQSTPASAEMTFAAVGGVGSHAAAAPAFEAFTDLDDAPRSTRTSRRPRGSKLGTFIAILATVVLLGVAGVVAAFLNSQLNPEQQIAKSPPTAGIDVDSSETVDGHSSTSDQQNADGTPVSDPEFTLVDDDRRTLWMPPTSGEPLDFRYLPPGGQIYFAIRPADLLAHPEGEKILAALGPGGVWGRSTIEAAIGVPLNSVEQLLISLIPQSASVVQAAYVVRLKEAATTDSLLAAWKNPAGATESAKKYYAAGDTAYFIPDAEDARLFSVISKSDIKDVVASMGAPPMRREFEQLIKQTDSQRTFTMLLAPGVFVTNGQAVLPGNLARLRAPIDSLLGPDVPAALLSMHLSDSFYAELRAVGRLDQDGLALAKRFQQQVTTLPDGLESYLASISSPYAQQVFLRMPRMIGAVSDYLRTASERNQAVLNCYLPATAAHNLVLGAELALSAQPGTAPTNTVATSPNPAVGKPGSVAEALQKRTKLTFDRNTLEQAIAMLSEDLGVKIVIAGGDLQLEGITKNQSFGLEEVDKTGEEILRTVLKKSNADNKLVYVIKPEQTDGPDVVLVTTRSAAEKRKDKLPAFFATDAKKK